MSRTEVKFINDDGRSVTVVMENATSHDDDGNPMTQQMVMDNLIARAVRHEPFGLHITGDAPCLGSVR